MESQQIKEKLTAIFKEVFEDDTIIVTESMTAADVENWDSLSNVMMISAVEDAFNIKLKLKEIVNLAHVGDLIKCIESHNQNK
jgi:acyl carrier protein